MTLPTALYTAAQTRALDQAAIASGIPGYTLMCRAGAAAWALLKVRWPQARRVVVLAGPGNNGGDGYVLARLAVAEGYAVELFTVGDHSRLQGEAQAAHTEAIAARIHVQPWAGKLPEAESKDVVYVDALLGTGLNKPPRGDFADAIAALNGSGGPVLALDIPSGLAADAGAELGVAVRATATITFIGLKLGLLTGAGTTCCGSLHFAGLDVPSAVYETLPPAATRLDAVDLEAPLAPRERDGHKGRYGHVLVIGGDLGMAGAAAMAAEAALRAGAGLVSVATRAEHAAIITTRRPEIMVHGVETLDDLAPMIARATVIVLGPGLGQGDWGRAMYRAALQAGKPLLLDADALNLLAQAPEHRADWVLTPHPGEAARLLATDTRTIQSDRPQSTQDLVRRYGGAVVLKGAGSLIADGQSLALCPYGNPGMSVAGMGDVLSGVVGALMAQGLAPAEALRLGVLVHALAGDDAAAEGGERGLAATDLLPFIRQRVNPCRQQAPNP